jgi:hypothetical protein
MLVGFFNIWMNGAGANSFSLPQSYFYFAAAAYVLTLFGYYLLTGKKPFLYAVSMVMVIIVLLKLLSS